jgi:hypothetical protein
MGYRVPKEIKNQLRSQYRKLNPGELKRQIQNLQYRLIQVALDKHRKRLK